MQAANKIPRRKMKKKKQDVIKELYQSHFAVGSGVFYDDSEAFGDTMSKKQPQIRGGFLNVNVFTESARTLKSRQLTNHIREGEYDIFMMDEIGTFWAKLDPADQWEERAWLCDSTAIFTYNTTEPELSEKLQYGGVGLVATSEIKHCIIDQRGKDPSSMGWWTWMRMVGKEGHHDVRYVSAYRSCQSGGASTVFQQQARVMAKNQDYRIPRTAMLEDMVAAIQEWISLGNHIILGMDANEDVRRGEVYNMLEAVGLREAILDLHQELSSPATYNRNTQRKPIDGIWTTSGITISKGRYLGFGEGPPSDHRVLWWEATFSVALGQRPPDSNSTQRLHSYTTCHGGFCIAFTLIEKRSMLFHRRQSSEIVDKPRRLHY
jgi:hypothetical protein